MISVSFSLRLISKKKSLTFEDKKQPHQLQLSLHPGQVGRVAVSMAKVSWAFTQSGGFGVCLVGEVVGCVAEFDHFARGPCVTVC